MARSFRENEAVGMFCSKSDDVADNVRWRARIEEAGVEEKRTGAKSCDRISSREISIIILKQVQQNR